MVTTLKHKNSDPLPFAEHAGYWPYSREQYSHTEIIFDRFKSWKYKLDELQEFFEELEKIERQLSKQYKKIAKAFEPSEDAYGGTSVYLTPIYNTSITLANEHDAFSKVMTEKINKKIIDIKREHDAKYKFIKSKVEENFNETSKLRSLSLTSINNHEKASSEKINTKQSDPWLTERVVVNVLEKMIENENSFQGFMKKVFEDMALFDCHTVEKLQETFNEYSNYKITQYGNLAGHYRNIIPVINNIQSAGPFQDFDRRYEITNSEIWNRPRSLENFAYKISPHNIIKEGVLYRTAEIRSSHWKPVWAVLTDTGYLHCFKLQMDKKIIRSHTVLKQGSGENILECGQKTYNDLKKPETYFSLKLSGNVICELSKIKKAPKYCFDIVVNNSIIIRDSSDYKMEAENIKKGKFGSNNSNKKKNTVFSLRADTQEIYDSWVDKISSQTEKARLNESLTTLINSPPSSSPVPVEKTNSKPLVAEPIAEKEIPETPKTEKDVPEIPVVKDVPETPTVKEVNEPALVKEKVAEPIAAEN